MLHYSALTFDYLDRFKKTQIKKDRKTKCEYFNIEAAFDIESTSYMSAEGKSAFMYIWMFGIGYGNDVFYGRTWEELTECLDIVSEYFDLDSERRLIVYVHNLGFEFQFMRRVFEWEGVFSITERKPIKALNNQGIEFRDSYILSGYSLAGTAKNLSKHKVKKMEGDLDYSLTRHFNTPLTDKEMGYCENDIVVILAYINEQIEQNKNNITKIPLTNTGRVRQYVKDCCYYTKKEGKQYSGNKYFRYRKIMDELVLNVDDYKRLKRAFMGGFTHSNPFHTNKTLQDVGSIDLTSSYPTVMLADMFPMSRGHKLNINSISDLKGKMKKYCLMFDIKIVGLRNKLGYESYISESKCNTLENPVVNNGRVFDADQLTMTIVDIDFQIIEQVYEWDELYIANVVGYRKNYLPKEIIEAILVLYEKKTTLKGVEGAEVEYLLSKGMLNSVYGMCVTDVVKDEHIYNDVSEWGIEKVDVEEAITKYNNSKSRFLYYPWGIWVTAYARRNLWSAILNMGNDYVYSDTDSIKALNFSEHQPYIDKYNERIGQKLSAMMQYYKLDESRLCPKTIDGIEKPLGVWEFEGMYSNFKTLGAKRYLIQEHGKFKLTVAGLSKKNGMDYIEDICGGNTRKIFNMFNNNLYVPADKTGKMTHTYIDEPMSIDVIDYLGNKEHIYIPSGTHLENCDYTLSITQQYLKFIDGLINGEIYRGEKRT